MVAVIVGVVIAAWNGNELIGQRVLPIWADRFGDAIVPWLMVAWLGIALMTLAQDSPVAARVVTGSAERCNFLSFHGPHSPDSCWGCDHRNAAIEHLGWPRLVSLMIHDAHQQIDVDGRPENALLGHF